MSLRTIDFFVTLSSCQSRKLVVDLSKISWFIGNDTVLAVPSIAETIDHSTTCALNDTVHVLAPTLKEDRALPKMARMLSTALYCGEKVILVFCDVFRRKREEDCAAG